ncbi:MAG: tetratricopeptide repeat protein [Piscinibacter sp.]|nr:tetratricopeptide repeat protein [Piscinibacter sp.]
MAPLAQALAAHQRGDAVLARRLYGEVLAAAPDHAEALHLLGVLDYQQGRLAAALAGLDRAVALAPGLAPAWSNRAAVLRDLGRTDEALVSLERALALQPDDPKALNNRAAALLDRGRAADALLDVQRALALDPGDAAAHHNHGNALLALDRPAEALASYERALALQPALAPSRAGAADALARLGDAALQAGHGEQALSLQRRALELAPDRPFLLGRWLHTKLRLCDWDGLDESRAAVARGIDADAPVCAPFVALHLPLSRAQQRRCARRFAATLNGVAGPPCPIPSPAPDGRLRVGFFSADFRAHATAQLAVGLLEQLHGGPFELTAFAFGPPADDPMRARLRAAFDHFLDVGALPDEAAVQLARERSIDIAIDLGGPTRDARPGLFARRVAPLQVAWLGFAGTQGAPWIDALIADPVVVPPSHAADYDEALLLLPHSYQANDDRRPLPQGRADRAALGLRAQAFVFCAFHSPAKLEPGVWAVWMDLLRRRPGSVLWLLQPDAAAVERLRARAAQAGVEPDRLVFAPRLPPVPHLERLRAADLFLDTFVCNAHTGASDALWAGVPVLTCRGDTFASRVAASLLQAARLPELITASPADYEALAFALSAPGSPLPMLRARLEAERPALPLFDTARFARAFGVALAALWSARGAGRRPRRLQVLEDALGDLRVVEDAPVAEPAGGVQPRIGQ